MLQKGDIEYLSTLARIEVSPEEKEELAERIDSVLTYVSAIAKVATEMKNDVVAGDLRNVMREDADPYPGGEWTEAILANAPHQEAGYFKVEQIM